jgi:hypothetical protein
MIFARIAFRALTVALIALATSSMATLPLGGSDAARADVTVIGDDDKDAFVGSGSLLLPPQIATDFRYAAAECPGCTWRSVVQCEMTTAGSCRGPARLCGPDGYWLRIFLTRPGGGEINLGAACFGSGGPVTRETAEARLRDRIVTLVPPLRPWRQPDGPVLPHIPVVFGVDQPETAIRASFDLIGLPIDLVVRPRWTWDFGTSRVATDSAGRRWPDATIAHTYWRSGLPEVAVAAVWEASYSVAGVGPLAVAQPVTQRAELSIPVGQGRAVLVR